MIEPLREREVEYLLVGNAELLSILCFERSGKHVSFQITGCNFFW